MDARPGPLVLLLLLSGCAGADTAGPFETGDTGTDAVFHVPPPKVGDSYRYYFGFSSRGFAAGGITDVTFLERRSIEDASGVSRDAVLVRQSNPEGTFSEEYWVDAHTLRQFILQRNDDYNKVTRSPAGPFSPLSPLPVRHTTYGNGSGILSRFLEDPVFEDANFFGLFASDRDMPIDGPYNVTGYLWQRNRTSLLAQGPWTGKVRPIEKPHETWGELRSLEVTVDHRASNGYETIHWKGDFSRAVPLAVDMVRHLKAEFGSSVFDVTFNATLLSYKEGDGQALDRAAEPSPRPIASLERAAAERWPAEGSGNKIGFPFKQAMEALALDPTAKQFFDAHAGSYVDYAHMEEIDTCGAYGATAPPGCHWYYWYGVFHAPDDWRLEFVVEKYADQSGAGAVVVPVMAREEIFETVFDLPKAPSVPPELAVVAEKSSRDLLPRSAYGADALTFGAVSTTFQATLSPNNAGRVPNIVAFFLDEEGYGFYAENTQWEFPPSTQPFFLYDDMPLDLERHHVRLDPWGRLLESVNFDVAVTHR